MVTDAPILVVAVLLMVVGEESSVAPPRSRSRSLAPLPLGSNSAQRILSPMLEVATKPPNAKRWAFPFIGVGASCKRTKGRAPGVWVQQIFTANTRCPMLPFTSGIPLFYKRVNPSHPIQTQPYRPHVELDFALNRSKLVGMSMRDYLSHASNLLHKN